MSSSILHILTQSAEACNLLFSYLRPSEIGALCVVIGTTLQPVQKSKFMHPIRELFESTEWIDRIINNHGSMTLYGDRLSDIYCYTEDKIQVGIFVSTSYILRSHLNKESIEGLSTVNDDDGAFRVDSDFYTDERKVRLIQDTLPSGLYDDVSIEYAYENFELHQTSNKRINLVYHLINDIYSQRLLMNIVNKVSPFLNEDYLESWYDEYTMDTKCVVVTNDLKEACNLKINFSSIGPESCPDYPTRPDKIDIYPRYSARSYIFSSKGTYRSILLDTNPCAICTSAWWNYFGVTQEINSEMYTYTLVRYFINRHSYPDVIMWRTENEYIPRM